MKYISSLLILSIICIIACNTHKENYTPFSTNNLPVEKFTINTEKDTVLQTENRAFIKIAAGALENKNGSSVTLEIKEAYSIEQIVRAGLFTQSNGQPLSSGGMIYINAAAGQEVTFKQKINVAIPADYLQAGMELYKGEEKTDGTVNWDKPDTLPGNKELKSIERGKILFQKCAACHVIGKDATGPNLAQLKKRFSRMGENENLYYLHYMQVRYERDKYFSGHFNSDSSKNTRHRDKIDIYKCNVRNMFGSVGQMFPELEKTETLRDVVNYIQNESDRLKLPLPQHAYLLDCVDSCELYNRQTAELRRVKSLSQHERNKFIKDNGEMTVVKPDSVIKPFGELQGFVEKVSPEKFDATYYQFTISSFGWYNIDTLLNGNYDAKESELFVRITGKYTERVNVFLIIPSVKVYGEGGPANSDSRKYAFFTTDGNISLPQNERAYILAVTEQDEKIAYGLKEFTTRLKQEFDVELKPSTKEQFESVIKSFDADRLHIKVDKTKNADSIRLKDKEIKDIDTQLKKADNLKPKNCDCTCGEDEG